MNLFQKRAIAEVIEERDKQDAKWGPPKDIPSVSHKLLNRPNGCTGDRMLAEYDLPPEAVAKRYCDAATERGEVTMAHILLEELCEVVAAPNDNKRRKELIQLAACCVKAVEIIDMRKANGFTEEVELLPDNFEPPYYVNEPNDPAI